MGAKPVLKRYKNRIYITCCIVAGLFLSGCQHYNLLRTLPTSIDADQKKNLATTQAFVLNKDYTSAAGENKRILEYFNSIPVMNDVILSNYVQNARIISILLARLLEEGGKKLVLHRKLLQHEKQLNALTVSEALLKKETAFQKNKLAEMDALLKKIKSLEDENKLLQTQIERLKEIDLNPDKTIGKPDSEGWKDPSEEFIPKIDNDL